MTIQKTPEKADRANQQDQDNLEIEETAYDGPDRRQGPRVDRRQANYEGPDRRSGWDRRRGPGRRRSDDRRSAEEGEMDDEQFTFLMAIDEYKRVNKRPFPSFTEILEITKALGYRKVADPVPINEISKKDDDD